MLNNLLKIGLVTMLALSMVGCQTQIKEHDVQVDEKFNFFVDSLPSRIFEPTDLSVNQLFVDPQSVGIEPGVAEWNDYNYEDIELQEELSATIYEELTNFEYELLSPENQETYDILAYAFAELPHEVDSKLYFYLDNNPLGEYTGIYNDVISSLYFYSIRNERDIESYLNLLDTLDEYAANLLEFEAERQEAGYGMSRREIDNVLMMLNEVLEDVDFNMIVKDFINDTNKLEGIDKTVVKEAQKEVEMNAKKQLFNFFEILKAGIEEIKPKYQEPKPISRLEGGKEYFANIVYADSGFENMNDYATYLDVKLEESLLKYASLLNEDLDLSKLYNGEITLYEAESMDDVLDYLRNAMAEDFPVIHDIEYVVEELPPSLQKLMPNIGAFYMVSAVDDINAEQRIVLNGEYHPTDFITLAHEGYPGHMYQHIYANSLNLPLIRKILSFQDYAEGYANYAQRISVKYADNLEMAELYTAYESFLYYLILRIDFTVNYLGEDASDIFEEFFGTDKNDIKDDVLYQQVILAPGSFINYYVAGSLIDDLYLDVLDITDNQVKPKEFHESILKHGSVPLKLLKEYVLEEYTD